MDQSPQNVVIPADKAIRKKNRYQNIGHVLYCYG